MGSNYFGVGVIVAAVAFIANLMSVSLQWWSYKELEYFGTMWYKNIGLWDWCLRTDPAFDKEEVTCGTITEPEDYESTTRTCVTLSLMLVTLGFIACCLNKCVLKGLPILGIIGALLIVASGFLCWIGVVTFANNYPSVAGNEPNQLHAGWGLACASSTLCYIAGVLVVADRLASKNQVYVTNDKTAPPAME